MGNTGLRCWTQREKDRTRFRDPLLPFWVLQVAVGCGGEGAGRDRAGGLAALPTSAFPETRSLGPGSVPEIPESSLQSWELGAIITPHLGNGEQSLREAGSLA